MKVRLLTLVALSTLAVPMTGYSDSANFNFYGTANVSFFSSGITNSAAESLSPRMRMVCNSCNFGMKGEEALSDGMKAVWQIENSVDVTGGGYTNLTSVSNISSDTTGSNTPVQVGIGWAGRNSGLGLSGSWGTVMFGNWDTPFKNLHNDLEIGWATGTTYMAGVLDTIGSNVKSSTNQSTGLPTNGTDTSFSRRQASSLRYVSPKLGDLATFSFHYNGNGAKDLDNPNPSLISTSLAAAQGMWFAGVAYEIHNDARKVTLGTIFSDKDTGLKLMAGIKPIDGLQLGAVMTSLKYADTVAAGDNTTSKSAFGGSAIYAMDSWNFGFSYATAGDSETCTAGATCATNTDTGASQMSFKVGHDYSKRTSVYAFYSGISNKLNGTYNFPNSPDQLGAASAGQTASLSTMGIGMRHTF